MEYLNYMICPIVGLLVGFILSFLSVHFIMNSIKNKNYSDLLLKNIDFNNFIKMEDIENCLLQDDMKDEIIKITDDFFNQSLKDCLLKVKDSNSIEEFNTKISDVLCDKIIGEVVKMDIGNLVGQRIQEMIDDKIQGTILKGMITNKITNSIVKSISDEISATVVCEGESYITPYIDAKLENMEDMSILEVIYMFEIYEDTLKENILKAYEDIVHKESKNILDKLNIQKVIENKINTDEINDTLIEYVKKELNKFIYLGSMIGLIVGLIGVIL